MGYEGANVIFDTWVHPLMMGLEEHLLGMFSDDFEFHNAATPSHLGGATTEKPDGAVSDAAVSAELAWSDDAEKTLSRIPFFVRGKARRNTETFARERGISTITSETLYDAKAHFGK